MAAYLLVLIPAVGIPFFLYCLWHFVRETNHGRSSIKSSFSSSRRDTVRAMQMSPFGSHTHVVPLRDEGRTLS